MACIGERLASSHVCTSNRAGPCPLPALPHLRAIRGAKRAFLPVSQSKASLRRLPVIALSAAGEPVVSEAPADASNSEGNWVPVCRPEDLPKGVRKEVAVDGRQVLLFWYRNQIYCIQARSPAEGAFSEGFIAAKFTQDYCIECPSTGSLFSLKDGSIVSWYPTNPVLRALTPVDLCKPLQIFPVKLTQDALSVDVTTASGAATAVRSRGGADTSLENNNVFSVQPTVYFEGMDPTREAASLLSEGPEGANKLNAAVAIPAVTLVGFLAVLGTAICIYLEDITLLAAFWAVLGGGAAFAAYKYIKAREPAP